MNRVGRFLIKRLLMIPLSLFIVMTLSFGLVELLPGDPALVIAGSFASAEQVELVREELGLGRPLGERYIDYMGSILRGDLGTSFFTGRTVTSEIARRLPGTVELIGLSLLAAAIIGFIVGTVGAYFSRRIPGRLSASAITTFQSTPDFFLALLFIYLFFFLAGIAPAPVGRLGIAGESPAPVTGILTLDGLLIGNLALTRVALQHLFLPVLALGLVYSAYFAKTARATMSDALVSKQVEFARACGLSEWQVIRYAFLQARTPIITYGAILFGALVGGAAIIETIFSWQGVGQWALEAILRLDIPTIQGFIFITGFVTIVVYLLLDLVTLLLDPRVTID